MNILITGGAGFIGSSLALSLIERGHVVTILDNLSEQIHGSSPEHQSFLFNKIRDKITFVRGDVCLVDDWEKVLPNQDVIVHFAAETGTGQSMYQIKKYSDVNIGGTAVMLDLLANKKHTVKKVVVASSRAIYGEGKYRNAQGDFVYPLSRSKERMSSGKFEVEYNGQEDLQLVATDENSAIHPNSVYGITKQFQEQLVMTVCRSLNIAPVSFRYQNVYGPGQSLKNPYTGILSIFSNLIKHHQPINIFEDGNETRDFVFINDVVEATIAGIESDVANGEIFNVGSGVPTTVIQVAQSLVKAFGNEVPLHISGDFRVGDIRHNFADLTKIQTVLGFRPRVSFAEGIQLFAKWVNQQDDSLIAYEQSLQEMKSRGLMK